jgi:hypothetical protein
MRIAKIPPLWNLSQTIGHTRHVARRQSARCGRSRGDEHLLHAAEGAVWNH